MKHFVTLVLSLVLPVLSFGQTNPMQRIQLKNGVSINGTVQLMSDGTYEVISTTGDTFYFSPSEVVRVVDLSESVAASSGGKGKTIVDRKYKGWVIGSGVGLERCKNNQAYYLAQSGYFGWNFTAGYRFGNFFLGLQSGLGYGARGYGGEDKSYINDSGVTIPVLLAARFYFSNWKAQPYVHFATGIELVSFSSYFFQFQMGPGVEIHFSPKISMFIEPLYCFDAPFAGGVTPSGFAAHIGVNFYL